MNQRSDIDRLLRHWMDDGPTTMPDRVVDVVADRISIQRQRRSWRLLRRLPMNPFLKLGAVAAAVLVVGVVAWNLLPGAAGPGVTPTPTPTADVPSIAPTAVPTPSPSPSAAAFACDDPAFGCSGVLAPGDHTTAAFRPALTFTTGSGWVNTLDRERAYTLHNLEWPAHFFQVFSQVAIPEQNASCTAERKAGVGTAVDDWVDFFTTHPGLDTTEPVPFTLSEHDGVQIDLHVAADWTAACPRSIAPAVLLITNDAAVPDRAKWIDDQRVAMWLVDVSGTTVIVYLESGPSDSALAELKGLFEPTIETFRFAPAG